MHAHKQKSFHHIILSKNVKEFEVFDYNKIQGLVKKTKNKRYFSYTLVLHYFVELGLLVACEGLENSLKITHHMLSEF